MDYSELDKDSYDTGLSPEENLMARSMGESLEGLRSRLLEISKRNPLINTRLNTDRGKQIVIVDELSDEIFRLLYRDRKTFTFLPSTGESGTEESSTGYEDDVYIPEEQLNEVHARHTDTKFQTELTAQALHKKLLALFREARSIEEELSVNVLYLALGFLKYFEAEASSIERLAPLILLPVELKRSSVKHMFSVSCRDEDLATNQSLAQMLLEEHDLVLPELPDEIGWLPSNYFDQVRESVGSFDRWEVEDDRMAMRFFSLSGS